MAMLPNIRIDIASSFNEAGFRKASRSSSLLSKQFNQMGKTLLAALSVRAIMRFSQTAVKEFAADQEAALKLAKTFDNLGMSFEGAIANDYINKLQFTARVADDQLRPALSQLIRTTLDFNEAQKILNTALDVSAGTGIGLEQIISALSKAYLGNTASLGRMNIGIGKVEAKTITFDEAMAKLNDRFGGQNALAADTYAGKLRLLSIAAGEARESIGQRMVTALELLAKDKTIEGMTDDMQKFADKIGLAVVGLGNILGTLNRKVEIGGRTLGEILFAAAGGGFIDALAKYGAQVEYTSVKKRTLGAPGAMQQAAKDAATRRQQLAEQKRQIALEKKAAAEKAKREALERARKRAQTIFDIENIQIVAALQGKIDGEQRARLVTLLAINTENYKAAEKLADVVVRLNEPALRNLGVMIEAGDSVDDLIKKLITSQARLAALQLTAEDFPELDNPFDEWEDSLEKILEMLMKILAMASGKPTSIARPIQPTTGAGSGASANEWMRMMDQLAKVGQLPATTPTMDLGMDLSGLFKNASTSNQANVNVYVQGNVVSENDLVSTITQQIYNQQKSGKQIVYSGQTI